MKNGILKNLPKQKKLSFLRFVFYQNIHQKICCNNLGGGLAMNSLPDMVVLDFCEWLNQQLNNNVNDRPPILDIFMGNGNNRYLLEEYAHDFLESKKTTDCPFQDIMMLFFRSEEYRRAIQKCSRRGYRSNTHCVSCYDTYDHIYCPEIHHAIHCFIRDYEFHGHAPTCKNISADHLAEYTKYMFLHGDTDDSIYKQPPVLKLMMNSSLELSEELDFFDWLESNTDCATDVRKMPADVFEKFVDKYIKATKRTEADKRQLLKSYRRTGWESLLEKFQVLFRIKERKSKSLSEVIERYYSHYGRLKCIILPLSDPESQQVYRSLINESWEDLNSCSGNYLDIYYSEVDTGRSGFDIAQRINSLPKTSRYKAPCIIVWERSMQDAEPLSISGLNNIQIVELIRSLVENIQGNKSFNNIIKEARNKVAELQNEKKHISNYYAPVITGDRNVVGDNNAVGTGIVNGTSNTITGNTIEANNTETISKTLEGFEAALCAINNSQELDENMKAQLIEIMGTAKAGISKRSNEKQEKAKEAFGYVKSFLIKVAPSLFETLANIATIATFFGIML